MHVTDDEALLFIVEYEMWKWRKEGSVNRDRIFEFMRDNMRG